MIINDYLKNNNLSKYQFSRISGLPYATLNDICSGKTDLARCSGETLHKLSAALGCTVDELLCHRFSSDFNLDRIKALITPVAEKHRLKSVYIFGSYARNEANENSDVDILIDREGSEIHGIFGMNTLFNELRDALGKEIDLVTVQSLDQTSTKMNNREFIENVMKEKVMIYDRP